MHTAAFIVIEDYIIITSKPLLGVLPAHFSFLLLLAVLNLNQLVLCKKVSARTLILILKIPAVGEKTSLKMFTSLGFRGICLRERKSYLN